MPNNLTIPSDRQPIGQCPHCQATIIIDKEWYAKIVAILKYLNSL